MEQPICSGVRSWENNWEDLATFFDYPADIRRMIYTTNTVEGYNRQLRKVTKSRGSFPTVEAVRKLLFLANRDIVKKWTNPMADWPPSLTNWSFALTNRVLR